MLPSRFLGFITWPKLNMNFNRWQLTVILCASLSCIYVIYIQYIEPDYTWQLSHLSRNEAEARVSLTNNNTTLNFDKKSLEVKSFLKRIKFKCREPPVNLTEFENIPVISESQCSYPYVEAADGGRLGNQLCRYMTLWLFRKHFGARVIIQKRSYEIMNTYFPKLSIPHKDDSCFPSNVSTSTEAYFKGLYKNFLNSVKDLKKNRKKTTKLISERNVLLGYPCENRLISNYRQEMRSEFKFKDEIIKEASDRLRFILEDHNHKRSNITLISVHVRRTDYLNFTQIFQQTLPDHQYFLQIMNVIRNRYNNVVFAIFSDDLEYCMKYLSGADTVIPGKGGINNPILDFTLITLCDHHIIGLGTFSFTSAFLGRGSIFYGLSERFSKKTQFWEYLCNPMLNPILIK